MVVYDFYVQNYENFKFKNRRFRTAYPYRNGVSALQKACEVIKKIPIEKIRIQLRKYDKYLKSKTDIKKTLRPFNREYEQFIFF